MRVRRQAVIKVLTDQSAFDSEPAIILTESNEHSKPCSAPNMKGDVICWQLASRRGSRRGERNGGRGGEERARRKKKSVTGREKGRQRKRGTGEVLQRLGLLPHFLVPGTRHYRHYRIHVLKHRCNRCCHSPARKPSVRPTS